MKIPVVFFLFLAVAATAGAFDVVLVEEPEVHLVLDREYGVFKIKKNDETAQPGHFIYAMIPEDDQSAVTFAVGEGFQPKTEKTIAEMFNGAKVKKVDGLIGQYRVKWWRYKDSRHLYSTCLFYMKWRDNPKLPVIIDLIANTSERLTSLEDSFSNIEMIEKRPTKR